jgi:hypothetical protein
MSDSDLSDAPPSASVPSNSELEQALRKQVRDALKVGKDDPPITVSSMRKAAEEVLGLEAGFYKNEKWKEESKRIVYEAFVRYQVGIDTCEMTDIYFQDEYGAGTSSPIKPIVKGGKAPKSSRPAPSKKRASPDAENGTTEKKRKTQPAKSSEEALSSPPTQLSEYEQPKTARRGKTNKSTKEIVAQNQHLKSKKADRPIPEESESEPSDVPDKPAEEKNANASDSDLSVLIDEDPPPKKKRKSSSTVEKRAKKPPAPKIKHDADIDTDQAEIKRLQGWLVKCGIRKLWGKELKPYETPKAKMKHLKAMLSDAGMTGRYSIERANQIKEERELRADIEAVQEGAERWGKNPEEADSDGRTKPKKRLVRGAQVLDFLSSDGEETD